MGEILLGNIGKKADQTYNPESENAQSGKAVAQAIEPKADKTYVDNTFANAIRQTVIGSLISVNDVSPIEHELEVKLNGVIPTDENLIPFPYDAEDARVTLNGRELIINKSDANNLIFTLTSNLTLSAGTYKLSWIKDECETSISSDFIRIDMYSFASGSNFRGISLYLDETEKTFTVESEATEIIIEIGVTGMDISTFTPVTLTNFHILPKLERVYESNYESNAEDINVTVSGKNLFNPNLLLTTPSGTATGWKYENGYYYGSSGALRSYYNDGVSTYECPLVSGWFKENTQYTLSFKVYTATEDTSSTIGFYFKYSDGKNDVKYVQTDATEVEYKHTSATGKTVIGIMATHSKVRTVYMRDIQLEEGATATDYKQYKGQTVKANADGTVTGLKSISPNMVITTDTSGVDIYCTYNVDTKKYIDNEIAKMKAELSAAILNV